MKLNIKLEKSTQLLKMPVVAISSNCIQVTDDFVGVGRFMNNCTINLHSSDPNIQKLMKTKTLVIPKTFL